MKLKCTAVDSFFKRWNIRFLFFALFNKSTFVVNLSMKKLWPEYKARVKKNETSVASVSFDRCLMEAQLRQLFVSGNIILEFTY